MNTYEVIKNHERQKVGDIIQLTSEVGVKRIKMGLVRLVEEAKEKLTFDEVEKAVNVGEQKLESLEAANTNLDKTTLKSYSIDMFPRLDNEINDSPRFQRAIDFIIRTTHGGALLLKNETYLLNGDIILKQVPNINNPIYAGKTSPITIIGTVEKGQTGIYEIGSCLKRTVAGDMFKLCMDEYGKACYVYGEPSEKNALGPIFPNFTLKNVNMYTESDGVIGINCYRCRTRIENINSSGLDYVMYQPIYDIEGNNNYCDIGIVKNIFIRKSKKGGIVLRRPDISEICNIVSEDSTSTMENLITVNGGNAVQINRVLISMNDNITQETDGSFIVLKDIEGLKISTVHIEKEHLTKLFYLENCSVFEISNVDLKFKDYHTFYFKNCQIGTIHHIQWITLKGSPGYGDSKYYHDFCFDGFNSDVTIHTLRVVTQGTYTRRNVSIGFFNGGYCAGLKGRTMSFHIKFDGENWLLRDEKNQGISKDIYGQLIWDTDKLTFSTNSPFKNSSCIIANNKNVSVNKIIHKNNSLYFYDSSNTLITTPTNIIDFVCLADVLI